MRRRPWGAYTDDLCKVLGLSVGPRGITVTESNGGSATTGTKRFHVEVNGVLLRDSRGVGRRFATREAAESAGAKAVSATVPTPAGREP
jgi:hypothetical protein